MRVLIVDGGWRIVNDVMLAEAREFDGGWRMEDGACDQTNKSPLERRFRGVSLLNK